MSTFRSMMLKVCEMYPYDRPKVRKNHEYVEVGGMCFHCGLDKRGHETKDTFNGISILADESLPAGVAVLRDKNGKELSRIENIGVK